MTTDKRRRKHICDNCEDYIFNKMKNAIYCKECGEIKQKYLLRMNQMLNKVKVRKKDGKKF